MHRDEGLQNREAGLRTRLILWLIERRLGHVPLGARIRARVPKLLEVTSRMDAHIAAAGEAPLKLKELAQLKVAAMVGCPF